VSTRVLLDFKARPAAKLLALSGKLTVQVKLAAAKQPDKKDNQGHEANNADTALGPVPVIAVIVCAKLSESTAGQKPTLIRARCQILY
jgi:hypothetical protein